MKISEQFELVVSCALGTACTQTGGCSSIGEAMKNGEERCSKSMNELPAMGRTRVQANSQLNQLAKESSVKTINLANIINELAWK